MPKKDPFLDELTWELRTFDIHDIPKTRQHRADLVHFIKRSNLMGVVTPEERADFLRRTQEEWIGKHVVSGGVVGRVEYILPKADGRMHFARKGYNQRVSDVKPTPFSAAVLWEGQNQVRIREVEHLELFLKSTS